MGLCIERIAHSCGTRKGLQVFQQDDGTINGWCFSCSQFVSNPYGDGQIPDFASRPKKSPEEIQAELEEIASYPVYDLPERKLRASGFDYFQCRMSVSEEDGKTPTAVYFPYTRDGKIIGYKVRVLKDKSFMFFIGTCKDADFFGWDQAIAMGAKRLIITEGEFDAIAMRRILELYTKEQFRDFIPAVVSLISGASSAAKDVARLSNKLRRHFKEVVFAFDMDTPGREAVAAACKVFPGGLGVEFPEKDANDCLMKGKGQAAFKAVTFNSQAQKNTRLVLGSSLRDVARKEAEWGYSWPWKHLNNATRGFRLGETWYFGAGVKMG